MVLGLAKLKIYLLVAGATAAVGTAIFFAGYMYRGEVEAKRTTTAVLEDVSKEAETATDLVDIGLGHAEKEVDIKVQNKLIEAEVKRRVKEFTTSATCYSDDGVRAINQALGYSESKDNKKPAN